MPDLRSLLVQFKKAKKKVLNVLLITSIIETRQSEMKIDLALIHIWTVLWLTISDIVL